MSTLKSCRCQKSHAEAPARVRSSGVVHTATQAKLFKRATFATAAERAVLESAFAVYFLGPWICPDTLDGGRTKMIWKGHGGLDFHFQTVECFSGTCSDRLLVCKMLHEGCPQSRLAGATPHKAFPS